MQINVVSLLYQNRRSTLCRSFYNTWTL